MEYIHLTNNERKPTESWQHNVIQLDLQETLGSKLQEKSPTRHSRGIHGIYIPHILMKEKPPKDDNMM